MIEPGEITIQSKYIQYITMLLLYIVYENKFDFLDSVAYEFHGHYNVTIAIH